MNTKEKLNGNDMPLDERFSMPKQEMKSYDPLPAGVYQVELTDIEMKDGTDFQGNPAQNLSFTFVVIEDGENYGRKLWANASRKFVGGTKPSNLYKITTGILNKQFTKEECASSDEWLTFIFLNDLLGKQNLLAVSQKDKQTGGKKNVIDSILPAKSLLPAYAKAD